MTGVVPGNAAAKSSTYIFDIQHAHQKRTELKGPVRNCPRTMSPFFVV